MATIKSISIEDFFLNLGMNAKMIDVKCIIIMGNYKKSTNFWLLLCDFDGFYKQQQCY